MDNERYVAAIEIGSSKIIAAIGRTDGTQLDIVATEQTTGPETVRFGIIQNAEEASTRILSILDRLEERAEIAPRKIKRLFVGIAGRSMRSLCRETSLSLPDEASEVTAEDLQALERQARESAVDASLKIIDVQPRAWRVGNTTTQHPKGMIGPSVGATFDLIVCRPILEQNLMRTLAGKLGMEVAGMVVAPMAAGHVLVTDQEKRLGCMLVDIGAETTTVVIFKNGHMSYFATLPLGGRNITLDLTSLKMLEERADEIKRVSGNAIAPDGKSSLTIDGVKMTDVNNLVSARAEEIAANICEQIHYAGLEPGDLPGGIIAMGGGFRLKGMPELVSRTCNLNIRSARLPEQISISDARATDQDLLQVGAVLYTAAERSDTECLETPVAEELPTSGEANPDDTDDDWGPRKPTHDKKPKSPSLFSKLLKRAKDAITYNDEDEDGEM